MQIWLVQARTLAWFRQRWPNVMIVVILAAGWLVVGCGAPPPTSERCGSIQFVNGQRGEPKVVVVLIDGAPSQEDGGKFYPVPIDYPDNSIPMVTNYCPIDPSGNERNRNNGWPDGLQDGLRRWSEFKVASPYPLGVFAPDATLVCDDHKSDKTNGALHFNNKDNCLVAQLTDAGAVLLPYSYKGTMLSGNALRPVFTLQTYKREDSIQDPNTSVQKLDDELYSIHTVWKEARIVVVGHSLGGLIAELWWECILEHCSVPLHHDPIDHRNVMHVFSLDSPINGVTTDQDTGTNKREKCLNTSGALFFGLGDTIAKRFCDLWRNRLQHNQDIINWASDAPVQYTAVGTPNDPTYSNAPTLGDIGNIQSQVIYQCDPSNVQCIAQPPSYVLGAPNAPDCLGNGNIYGTTGHDIVKVCPQVIQLILKYVQAAAGGNPGADLTTVDWNNFTYPSKCFLNGQQQITVRNGVASSSQNLNDPSEWHFQVNTPTFGDLTGDGQPEAVIPYNCVGADSGTVVVFVYTGNASKPILIGDLSLPKPDPNVPENEPSVDSVMIDHGVLQLTSGGYTPQAAHCCPDLRIRASYRWNGSQFELVDSSVTRLET